MSRIRSIFELLIVTGFVLIINIRGDTQDKKDICRHRGSVAQKNLDIEDVAREYKDFEQAIHQSLIPRIKVQDLKIRWAEVKSCNKSQIRTHKITSGKVPVEFLGSKILFTSPQKFNIEIDQQTKIFIVAGPDLKSTPELKNEVYFVNAEFREIFGVRCIPSLVIVEDEKTFKVEEFAR